MNDLDLQKKLKDLRHGLKTGQIKSEAHETKDAIKEYKNVVLDQFVSKNEDWIKIKEEAIYALGRLYAKSNMDNELSELNVMIRPFFDYFPKAKTAKIVKTILELFEDIPNTMDKQISICKESIEWSKKEKRTFLRQRIETRLASLYYDKKMYNQALEIINNLVSEVKRMDDKALLVEIQLSESKVQHALKNISKAKAALTSGRTAANSIYCPINLQSDIDMQSGVLNVEEKDYKTAFSYFYEAFEGYHSLTTSNTRAILALKYMLLCKIMTKNPEDVQSILSGKNALKYSGNEINSMREVATAYQARSLHEFETALSKYENELVKDPLVHKHIGDLYGKLFEQHLLRIIEPFSRVEITHIAKLLKLPKEKIESKLSQMILDKQLQGIIDQGKDCLIVLEEPKKDVMYSSSLKTLENMNQVMDSLFERAQELTK